ncbi:MAG: metallophosphatase domain-containing protein [Sandaracinus sp.]|nr:metallophosphatase domain-containing protein [Myxococcales bacterium]MCB9612707.1 metallophosphatase domain-containing protein [Sandaracinus sp.]MCB9633854.1 metallophosphatase domain-containing protein [Sandaracinus sp.]
MKLALLSDTHGRHTRLTMPRGIDAIVHAGDFTRRGDERESVRFLEWLASFDVPKLLVGGNHDRFAERAPEVFRALCAARGIVYLAHEGATFAGLRVFGSPFVPRFRNMAFNLDRGAPLATRWRELPRELDLLVTHGPPHGTLDRIVLGRHVGCEALRDALREVKVPLHVMGHIHEAHGEVREAGRRSLNVANATLLSVRDVVTVDL